MIRSGEAALPLASMASSPFALRMAGWFPSETAGTMPQPGLIGVHDLATVRHLRSRTPHPMPLHFGKIFGAIALLTVAAFVLWLLFTTFFATEQADQKIERTGAVELGGGSLARLGHIAGPASFLNKADNRLAVPAGLPYAIGNAAPER